MIGKKLRYLRKEAGLTLKQLAKKLDKEYPQFSEIENGKVVPRDETIMDILVIGLDTPYSKAKNMVAQWRIEESLNKADDPEEVLKSVVIDGNMGNIFINSSNNNVNIQ